MQRAGWHVARQTPQETARASHWAGLFENSRRTTWPFHIHNPVRTIVGRKTYRVGPA